MVKVRSGGEMINKGDKVMLSAEQIEQIEDDMFEKFKGYVDEQWQTLAKILEFKFIQRLEREIHFTKEDKVKYDCIRKIMDTNTYELLKQIENQGEDNETTK